MITLADINLCTGCGACSAQCPRSCISMVEGDDGILLPKIDVKACIECHSCENVCPVINSPERYEPQQAYAAWSNDVEERRTSASGGVAVEIYKYAISKGWKVVGASQNEDFSVTHKVVYTIEEVPPLKNSKYVFSDAYEAFAEIKSLLKDGEQIVFIGLPCQVAALRKLFRDDDKLLLIEVVCHGTTPLKYLRQHISYLESCIGHVAKRMSFRDPDTYTYTYTFTLYDEQGKRFYAQKIEDGDYYQIGFHKGFSYRENCYHCSFARRQRIADITIGDYHGLGKIEPWDYPLINVSCILINTEKGKSFMMEFINTKTLTIKNRPIDEPIMGDSQLREPTKKQYGRLQFQKKMPKYHYEFDLAMKYVVKCERYHKILKKAIMFPGNVLRRLKNRL